MLIVILAACASDNEDNEGNSDKSGDVSIEGNYVTPDVILDDIENGETFSFVIVDKDCSACQAYKAGALLEFEENNPGDLRYVEINGIQERAQEFEDIETLIIDHLDGQFDATPTTYFIVDGELASVEVGVMEYEELLSIYESHIE